MMSGWAEIKELALGGGAAGGTGVVVWKVLAWLEMRADKRQARLDAQDAELDKGWKDYRLLLERRLAAQDDRLATIERQARALRSSFEHVASALIRVDPGNPALGLAEQLMREAFPSDFTVLSARADAAFERTGETA